MFNVVHGCAFFPVEKQKKTAGAAMKIDICIIACDFHPLYYLCWSYVAQAWKNRIQVEPILYLICKNEEEKEKAQQLKQSTLTIGTVVIFDAVPNVPTGFQSQCIRNLVPALYPEQNVIISDMDMLPVSYDYFQTCVQSIPENHFVVYRKIDHMLQSGQIPMCYVAAKGSTWKEIFKVETLEQVRETLTQWGNALAQDYRHSQSASWYSDQVLLFQAVTQFMRTHSDRVQFLNDADTKHLRLDRIHEVLDIAHLDKFTDFHMPRPMNEELHRLLPALKEMKIEYIESIKSVPLPQEKYWLPGLDRLQQLRFASEYVLAKTVGEFLLQVTQDQWTKHWSGQEWTSLCEDMFITYWYLKEFEQCRFIMQLLFKCTETNAELGKLLSETGTSSNSKQRNEDLWHNFQFLPVDTTLYERGEIVIKSVQNKSAVNKQDVQELIAKGFFVTIASPTATLGPSSWKLQNPRFVPSYLV